MKRIICCGYYSSLCIPVQKKNYLFLGNYSIENGDTIYSKIPDFNLWTQDSVPFTSQMLENKIHLAAFFFTSCPTICPKVMRNMMRIEENFSKEKRHTLFML